MRNLYRHIQKSLNYFLSFIIIIFICFSCKKKVENTCHIIPREKFIWLLVDYHLAQGISNTYTFRQKTKSYERINLCDSVIIAHGYTRAQFDSTLLYYSTRVNEFNKIYERVITELNKMQAKIEEKKTPLPDSLKNYTPVHR